ncbi:olfactory receptor 1030-like [Hemicordylus capensis]|uniref:olfactory receptor 1030-like n=1 Tax=Hemicordylus capensis TaxID=884348 RepID=UPI0023035785|nr:olfactory receptor 1030-like [Hemicordylus capensis]
MLNEETRINPMENKLWENQTVFTEFILLGFGDIPTLRGLLFLVVLMIYIATMAGNILIVALVVVSQELHTPMYYFLGNLSCLETCCSSTILPRMLTSFVRGDRSISLTGCFLQMYFFGSLAGAECFLLTAMSYDQYLAICKPLHYATIMKNVDCLHLVVGSWIIGFLGNAVLFPLLQVTFCGHNEISHFYFTIFYGTLMIVYVMPNNHTLGDWKKVLGAFYTFLTPMVNPFIYSLRNKDVKQALRKIQEKMIVVKF